MELLLLGREPISADQPTGLDVRYDLSFEELQAEIDKISSPSGAGAVDWEKIVKLSSEILSQKSKDLLVATYLAIALIYTRQIDGFSIGLRVYRDLLEQFWDGLYPPKKRIRGRLSAIEWWLEKTETALKQLKQAAVTQDQFNQLQEDFEKIDQFLRQNLEEPPLLRPILEFLNSVSVLSEGQAQPCTRQYRAEAESEPQATQEAVKDEKAREEEKAEISSPQDAQRALKSALQKMSRAAAYFWQQDLSNPLLYRLDRAAIWLTVEGLPPSTDGRTRIPPPASQLMNILYDLRNKGDSEALLRAAEEKLPQFIFWLDLNRLVSEALTSLGERYQAAYMVVCRETASLNQRLPGLENLSFSDGTPFADHETKQWLKEIGSAASESLPVSESGSTAQEEDLIQKEVQEAQILIRKRKLLEAVERLQQRLRDSFSEKERLLWRLAIAQLLINTKNSKLVLPHLEQIVKDIDFYRLEEYDPLLALKCFKLVWLGFKYQSGQTSRDKVAEILQRIAKLDMAEVIRMEKD